MNTTTPTYAYQRPARFLVADDERGVRECLQYLLEHKLSCEVTCAANANEVIDRLEKAAIEKDPFDVVILDLQMPLESEAEEKKIKSLGLLLIEDARVKKRYLQDNTEIIVFTAHARSDFAAWAKTLGVTSFISKDRKKAHLAFLKVVDEAAAIAARRLAL